MAKQRVFVVFGWTRARSRADFSTLRVFTTESEAWAYGRLLEGTRDRTGRPEWSRFTVDETELCTQVPPLDFVKGLL